LVVSKPQFFHEGGILFGHASVFIYRNIVVLAIFVEEGLRVVPVESGPGKDIQAFVVVSVKQTLDMPLRAHMTNDNGILK
jgi:hypothetical protein